MDTRIGFTGIILSLCLSGCKCQEIVDCNIDTTKFTHEVKAGAAACSSDFHNRLQEFYPTDGEFQASVEIQPPRSIMAPRPMKYSAMGNSIFFSNTTNWGSICQLWVAAAECLAPDLQQCDIAVAFKIIQDRMYAYKWSDYSQPELLAPEYSFSERTCQSGMVRADLQKDLDNSALDLSCLNQNEKLEFKQCISPLIAEIVDHETRTIYTSDKDKMVFDTMSGSVLRCVRNILDMSTCNAVSQRIWNHIGQLNLPSIFVTPPDVALPDTYDFSHQYRCTVGAYGDPHFRLCSQPKLVTCSLPGEHIFLSNHFFEIRGTNSKVETRNMIIPIASAITRIQILFKSIRRSLKIGSFEAENGNLPAGFKNVGTTQIGQGEDTVNLTVEGNKRTFTQESTGMIIIVRKIDKFYHVMMRMSEQVIHDSYGIFVTGCTMLQTVNTKGWIQNHRSRTKRDLTVDQCIEKCRELPEKLGLRVACGFDCGVTGNQMFVDISREAWKDMLGVKEVDQKLRSTAKTSWVRERSSSSSGTLSNSNSILYFLFLIYTTFVLILL